MTDTAASEKPLAAQAGRYGAVVVTGAAGWLGRNLVSAITEGIADCDDLRDPPLGSLPLHLIDRVEDFSPPAGSTYAKGELSNSEDCNRVFAAVEPGAVVFHLAGIIHPRSPSEFTKVNLEATRNVVAAAKAKGAKRLVVMSSNSVNGCNPSRDELFTEESPYKPYMGYGRSKMEMEQFVRGMASDDGLEWSIIRAPWLYGPNQPPRQTLFFQMIRDGKGPVVGDGENRRSMAYTGNLSQGLIRAALLPKANKQIYWIADSDPYTMNQIIDTVEDLLEKEFGIKCAGKRLRLPGLAAEFAYLCDWILQGVGLYHQKVHVLSEMNKTIACSVDKARRELGFDPKVALKEGMRRSIADLIERNGGL